MAFLKKRKFNEENRSFKKEWTQQLKEDNLDMINYHCIVHQSVLCASMGDEFYNVMETIMKIVNFLRSTSALQHRLL